MNSPKFTKGGRGVKAPYQTTHIRLPVDLKPYLEEVVSDYKKAVELGQQREFIIKLYNPAIKNVNELKNDKPKTVNNLSKDDIIETARKLVRAKKGAKYSLENLLTFILGEKIEL